MNRIISLVAVVCVGVVVSAAPSARTLITPTLYGAPAQFDKLYSVNQFAAYLAERPQDAPVIAGLTVGDFTEMNQYNENKCKPVALRQFAETCDAIRQTPKSMLAENALQFCSNTLHITAAFCTDVSESDIQRLGLTDEFVDQLEGKLAYGNGIAYESYEKAHPVEEFLLNSEQVY